MMELSFSRPFVPGNIRFPGNIRSLEIIAFGTFVSWTTLGNFLFLSTEIVDCTKRLNESYAEIDAEFSDELVHFLHFLSTQKPKRLKMQC